MRWAGHGMAWQGIRGQGRALGSRMEDRSLKQQWTKYEGKSISKLQIDVGYYVFE
jgi:hypothetical protein